MDKILPLSKDSVTAYFELARRQPELFVQSDQIRLVMDEAQMRTFAREHECPLGVVFDNAPYYYVVADLCLGKRGLYRYSRVIYCNPRSNGVVIVPVCGKKFGVVTIFRHAPRMEGFEFPRGFSETEGLSPEENAYKEIFEELGIGKEKGTLRRLGELRADTGLSAGKVQVFAVYISDTERIRVCEEEGISRYRWIEEAQFQSMIGNGGITDGFTLAAYAMYRCQAE